MVIALFAALIVPWFVNWNDYRASFEAEASRILGHRVHVEGDAHATILPSPSLTFTNVAVDDESGQRIMDVGRFDVVIELMPLLQGEIRVVSMELEKAVVNVTVDAAGKVAWLSRAKLREPFDPDKVILDNISVQDGVLNYTDQQTGVQLTFPGISAQITARALLGPWHVDGSYLDDQQRVQFAISTGRVLDDGSLRVKANLIPARWPVTVSVDGPVGIDPSGGLAWHGTYSLAEVALREGDSGGGGDNAGAADGGNASDGPTGWRSEGTFALTGDRLDIDKAVLSNGPADRPLSVAGTLSLTFGKTPSFSATAEARQVDLDRTLGKGPSAPVDVSAAADSLVAWLSQLPVPNEPGSIRFSVPTIVVGGRIIENVGFVAAPAPEKGGWQVGSLTARLPGQATLEASGLMTTREKFGFDGRAHLAVAQPATFATWWRGESRQGAGRLLAPFDLSGHADIGPGHIELDHITAQIADATITGGFGWAERSKDRRRALYADLDATRVDYVQVKALAELLLGRNLTNAGLLADSYSLHVKADAIAFEDLTVKGIEVNAEYGNDALTVTTLRVDDIGGASIEGTNGKIDNLSGDPRGHLVTTFDAPQLTGLALLADRFLPESGFTRWLDAAAPALGEMAIKNVEITAPLPDGGSGFVLTVDQSGVAGSTTIEKLSAAFTGGFSHWRTKPADIAAVISSLDSAQLARQFGLSAVALANDEGAKVTVQAKGVPADGLDMTVMTTLAGLHATARGKLTIAEDLASSFTGTIDADSDNLDPLISLAGLTIPGTGDGTPLWIDKAPLSVSGKGVGLSWKNGTLGAATVSGNVTLAPDGARAWRIGGDVVTDEVSLGWIASLGLGFPPLPSDDPEQPWSRKPFDAPGYGPLSGKLAVAVDKLDVGSLGVTGAAFTLALQPQRIDVDLTKGQLAGGTVTGGMSVHNVGGNVNFGGRFDLKGAALESFVWRREGRSVATGTLDLSANFESTGRSPAGLVSTMTGGGVLTLNDGLARYVNPNTVRQIVRASDLGQQFSEDALRAAFGERIDADNLSFRNASGAFAIVAGAVRLKNLMVKADGLTARGNAVVDFNTMTLDSDWNLAFEPVDNKVQNLDPEAGIVFHGPIASPTRSFDVLPFAAYLNEREAARMTEIIALDAATRAEKDRLNRLLGKLKADADQRAEDRRIAAEREAARLAAAQERAAELEAFHVSREIVIEKRHVDALAALAARLAERQNQAEADAAAAAKAAQEAGARSADAAKVLADARAAEQAAAAKAAAAADDLQQAKAKAAAAGDDAAQLAAAADNARQSLADATARAQATKAEADKAAEAKAEADKALQAATARAAQAAAAADKAGSAAEATAADKAKAVQAAADAVQARDEAKTAFAAAEAALKKAQEAAAAAVNQATAGDSGEARAAAAQDTAQAEAKAAADALAKATAERDAAAATYDKAKSDAAAAEQAAAQKAAQAKQAEDLAQALAAGDNADEQAVATAQAMQTAAAGAAQQAAARKAAADAAKAALADAQSALETAKQAVADAQQRADAANAAVAAADQAVKNATANAEQASSDKSAALADLDTRMNDAKAARAALDEREAAMAQATARAQAAAQADADAVAAVAGAEADLKQARAAKAAAEDKLAELAAAAADATKAAQAASLKRIAVKKDADVATAKAHAAAQALAAAQKAVADKAAASGIAEAAARSAAQDRQVAEDGAAKAAEQAKTAQAAAEAAGAEAETAAAEAQQAQQSADRAAQAAAGTDTTGSVPVPSKQGSAAAPAAKAVAQPVSSRDAAVPLPRVPKAIPTDGPLVITPPKY